MITIRHRNKESMTQKEVRKKMNNLIHSGCPAGEPGQEGIPSANGIPEEWLQGLHENLVARYPSNLLESQSEIGQERFHTNQKGE